VNNPVPNCNLAGQWGYLLLLKNKNGKRTTVGCLPTASGHGKTEPWQFLRPSTEGSQRTHGDFQAPGLVVPILPHR